MGTLRERAERTPPSRDRYIDLLRSIAIILVVVGHWLASVIDYDRRGELTGHSALESLPWAYPITWLVQVMPLFFIVGGYANGASLTSNHRRGGDTATWLRNRAGRLVPPTTTLLVVLAGSALVARLLGANPGLTRMAVWVASIPLWFLSAYLVVVLLAPIMYWLHQRFGWRVLLVLVGLVGLGDLARLLGAHEWGDGNFVFGWLAIHQIGFAWRDGQLLFRPRLWLPLLVGGLVMLLLLTVPGPYSVSMVDVSGERMHNASPPTLALLADAAFQLGLVLLLRGPAERWLRRSRPWLAVVAVNTVVLTVFLWHMSAVLLAVGLLNALDALPTPAAATEAWWLWRPPWLVMLTATLTVLVAMFGRIEIRGPRPPAAPRPRWLARAISTPVPRLGLTVAAFAAVIAGLLSNSLAPRVGQYLVGMPAGGLLVYLIGAAALRLLPSTRTIT
ncbi:acyltransferase [Frankia sp. CNm7]|uniref:Acyltransferase n=1 Tax=Frankia nepalensis TaxID=1836974 RepID=A0A937RFN6_9ACTN|nr:acyltransferase [Frankia nepalensis]MBL7502636.1 acyltransferase [Frankia nepalensis]MBL7514848.1 acyltransferase [Frankia nepalensis]MBL7520883.1 acyltransferase [Frankia nepalensis]MBL7626544.1 acyltransferase [Frankia nepalensis]